MNVVEQWRDRARGLRAEYWRCAHCHALSAVRRIACVQCGHRAAFERTKLPSQLKAVGWSHAHLAIETLDQAAERKPAVLLEVGDGRVLPLPLAEADAPHAQALVGEMLDIVLRRTKHAGEREPVAYGRKAAAGAATRIRLLKKSDNAKQENGSE